jgi:hypothetical protein
MIKKDVVLSKREISLVSGGFDWKKKAKEVVKAAGEGVQQANQAIDKGARKAGEVARELNQDFQAGKQTAREEAEVPKADSQPSAPADNCAKEV